MLQSFLYVIANIILLILLQCIYSSPLFRCTTNCIFISYLALHYKLNFFIYYYFQHNHTNWQCYHGHLFFPTEKNQTTRDLIQDTWINYRLSYVNGSQRSGFESDFITFILLNGKNIFLDYISRKFYSQPIFCRQFFV